ncbi:MAG: hypothetical protein KDN05_10360, partial [Verrucomicrobiae bacterium]|nr:hypothetical protein [Verrucomicrobiae bacterium]
GLLASIVDVKDTSDPLLERFLRESSTLITALTANNHRPGPFEIFFPIASHTAAKAMLGETLTRHPNYPAYREVLLRHQSSWPDYKSNSSQKDGRPVRDVRTYDDVPSNIGNGNFRLLVVTAGLLSAQEFPELQLVSIDPKSREERVRKRDEVLRDMNLYARGMLASIVHHNFDEYGAPIYLAIDYAPVHMLAEHAADPSLRKLACDTLDWMYSSLATSSNQRRIITSNARSKGDFLGTGGSLGFLGWLQFDPKSRQRGNLTCFNVYPAWPGNYKLPEVIRPHSSFPYVKREAISRTRHVHLYAFQSKSFGLVNAMEARNPAGRLKDQRWDRDGFFKEAARNKLNWFGKRNGGFSPQWQNSRQPYGGRRNQANARYYGTNPWSMVLQNRGTQIGLADVPPTYPCRKLYATYDDRGSILLRVVKPDSGWTLCHTGETVFAFRSLKPPTKANDGKAGESFTDWYDYKKTAWLLEVFEAPSSPADKPPETLTAELEAFHRTLLRGKVEAKNLDDASPEMPVLSYQSAITGRTLTLDFAKYPITVDGEGMPLEDYPVLGTYPDEPGTPRVMQRKDKLVWFDAEGAPALTRDFAGFPPP